MTLTQQFLIVLIFPAGFLVMAAYSVWRRAYRPRIVPAWVLTLLTGAAWTSSLLSYYGGVAFSPAVTFTWQGLGRYLLSFMSLALLLTTTRYLLTPRREFRLVLSLSAAFWLIALLLDPNLWPYEIGSVQLAGQVVTHFYLWSAVWVASWLVALLAAWLLTRRAYLNSPGAMHRNQLAYWQLMLLLFGVGGAVALVQHPGQPIWQEVGAAVQLMAAWLGVYHLTHTALPDLRVALRRLTGRLATAAVLFALSVFALWFLVLDVLPRTTEPLVAIVLGAAVFTLLFLVVNRLVRNLLLRLLLPSVTASRPSLAEQPDILASLADPLLLGELVLRHVQANLSVEDGQLFWLAEEGPGRVLLQPVASIGSRAAEALSFIAESSFIDFLRRAPAGALAQYDLDALELFADLPEDEREGLRRWQDELYIPLRIGDQLVGLLGLGNKYNGLPYTNQDIDWLQALGGQAGLLLWQSQQLATLQQEHAQINAEWVRLTYRNQQLEALNQLHHQFAGLVTPDLRRPAIALDNQLQQLKDGAVADEQTWTQLSEQVAALRPPLDNLVTLAAHLQDEPAMAFSPVHIIDVARQVRRGLATMADARKVTVNLDVAPRLPAVRGDEERLVEALRHVVHNAIKYNKIGGDVQIHCFLEGEEICIAVSDKGVGIPPERIDQVWTAFKGDGTGRYNNAMPSLGLLFARYIVAAHGGRMTVASEYGAGSTFMIFLPPAGDVGSD